MSMLDTLRRWIDPIAHREIVEERRRKVEAPAPKPDDQKLACRLCGHEGGGRFCPRCLAPTMEARRRR